MWAKKSRAKAKEVRNQKWRSRRIDKNKNERKAKNVKISKHDLSKLNSINEWQFDDTRES